MTLPTYPGKNPQTSPNPHKARNSFTGLRSTLTLLQPFAHQENGHPGCKNECSSQTKHSPVQKLLVKGPFGIFQAYVGEISDLLLADPIVAAIGFMGLGIFTYINPWILQGGPLPVGL